MKPRSSRRGLFMKLGMLFNGVVAAALAVPIVRYLLSSVTRGRANGYLSWVPLGRVSEFPEGETRLATFRNPFVMPTDGKTADTACWVRRIDGEQFQVFAVNCAHLGCPVRWFPQSGLFMCPCHGGAYYRDGSRASGPPERGLFEYPLQGRERRAHHSGRRNADAGSRARLSIRRGTAMRLIAAIGEWFDHRLQLAAPIREAAEHPVPRNTASWWYVFGSAALTVFLLQLVTGILLALVYVPSAGEAWSSLQALNHEVALGWFIRALHGWGSNFMVAIVLIHMVQVFLFGAYKFPRELTWIVGVFLLLMTLGMAFTGQVLRFDQDAYWGLGIGASIASRVPIAGPAIVKLMLGGPIIAGATLSRFFALHVFVIPGTADRLRVPAPADGAEAGNQRMADAGTRRPARDLPARIPRADEERRRAVRSLRRLEGPVLRGVHPARGRRVRAVFRPVRSERPAGSDDHPDRAEARLLLPVALRPALAAAAVARDAGAAHRPGRRDRRAARCFRFSPAKARRAGSGGRSRC